MQLIKPDININFISKQKFGFGFSILLIIISITSLLIHKGPNLGIDFAGGTIVQIKFSEAVSIGDIRSGLANIGLENSSVQDFGTQQDNEFLIRTSKPQMTDKGISQSIAEAVGESTGQTPKIRRVEMVGPQVGKDLQKKALLAIFYTLLCITIYISGRFELKWMLSGVTAGALMTAVYFLSIFQVSIPFLITAALVVSLVLFWSLKLKYAIGAIVALVHDVLITVGIFSVFGFEFSLPIIAALLTIIGYSLNDTIIVFDRIRENIKGVKNKDSLPSLFNRSINETLSRTILTSVTTLIVLFCLYFLGGEIINNFAFAMIIGVIIGTYSSIFVASPIVLAANKR
ncbi:MAG: protein translocase subunit SecF [Desulfobacteraceae bacterium]|nr:protein translocase subunit SecF [Desulfobacteraceae bacterium]